MNEPSLSPRYKILLVDDDAVMLRSLTAVLELEQCLDVTSCESAERALRLLSDGSFHVVCTDYALLGMNGVELLERVKQLPQPVGCLLLTGSSLVLGGQGNGAGEHYMLAKPADPNRLTSLILQLARTAEMKRGTRRGRNSYALPHARG